jgi:excisionase family DNA binding protein
MKNVPIDDDHAPFARALYTTASLARELGTSERTIRRAIETGELPASRRAGRWVMTAVDVLDWAQSGRRRKPHPPRTDLPRSRGRRSRSLRDVFADEDADAA